MTGKQLVDQIQRVEGWETATVEVVAPNLQSRSLAVGVGETIQSIRDAGGVVTAQASMVSIYTTDWEDPLEAQRSTLLQVPG